MSAAISIVCDGRRGTCTSREIVVLAETPQQARHRLQRHGWGFVGGDDLCRGCMLDTHGVLSESGVVLSAYCEEGVHHACHASDCSCTCHGRAS